MDASNKKGFGAAGRMYGRVPFRGCNMRIADGGRGAAELYATGFRSPNGIGFDGQGAGRGPGRLARPEPHHRDARQL